MKYIYFELHSDVGIANDGWKSSVEEIKSANFLVLEPSTNSDGFWGFTNNTPRHSARPIEGTTKHPQIGSLVVKQFWIDLNKFDLDSDWWFTPLVNEVYSDLKKRYNEKV